MLVACMAAVFGKSVIAGRKPASILFTTLRTTL